MALLFLIYPILAVVLFTVVESWLWRILFVAASAISFPYPPYNLIVAAGSLILIAVGKPLVDINNRLKY